MCGESLADSTPDFAQRHAAENLVAGITVVGGVVRFLCVEAHAACDVAVCVLNLPLTK